MMEKPIVACIQHRLLVSASADEYHAHLHRFLRTAKAKGASLALFPELSGLAFAIPIFSGWRSSLLKTASRSKEQPAGVWQRTKSRLAGGAASVVRADLGQSLQEALKIMPESLRDAYISGFSELARQYEMTIVAGSQYELDPETREMHNVSLVFGPDGEIIGKQAKVVLGTRDHGVTQPADGWGVIATPVGRIGILLGSDVLYPEPARILAYQGADMLLTMGAVTKPATYYKIRQAALSRCQENQLYGMVSFLVGTDPFAPENAPKFVGKSAIFAPLEFTHRFTGVMVEVGSPLAEGVITAEWDYPALEELWLDSETPLRREMPLLQAGPILASVYSRALPLADNEQLMIEAAAAAAMATPVEETEYAPKEEESPEPATDIAADLPIEDADYAPRAETGLESEDKGLPSIGSLWPDSTLVFSDQEPDFEPGPAPEQIDGTILGIDEVVEMEEEGEDNDTAEVELQAEADSIPEFEDNDDAITESESTDDDDFPDQIELDAVVIDDEEQAFVDEIDVEPETDVESSTETVTETIPQSRGFRWPWQK